MADGDGRYLLNMVEQIACFAADTPPMDTAALSDLLSRRAALYDKDREEHYNLISALHKSLRGSDPDAALYWFARMLNGGEDPRYIARRLVRFAAEDIGMADPRPDPGAGGMGDIRAAGLAGGRTRDRPGRLYLGTAPKSNAVYTAFGRQRSGKEHRQPDAAGAHPERADQADEATRLRRRIRLDHSAEDAFSGQNYFPEGMERRVLSPRDRGFEREVARRLEDRTELRAKKS